jgi:GT2 family glycosyltransferase
MLASDTKSDVALLVLNWNGADLMERHLPAVVEDALRAEVSTRVYVIDNGSTDRSREVVASFEGVELLAYPDNRKLLAYNDGVAEVECEAFMMLNNDLSPPPGATDALLAIMREDPSIFAVGGAVVDVATGDVESGPTAARWKHEWVLEPLDGADDGTPVNVAYVSGGAGLYRRDMFLALGGFWNALPAMYWEDVELGLRAWLHGWRSVFRSGIVFDHESGATIKRSVPQWRRELGFYRNQRLTHLGLLLDQGDLRDYLLRELRRSVRKPYYWPAMATLLPRLLTVASRRRELRARHGPVTAAQLERKWFEG